MSQAKIPYLTEMPIDYNQLYISLTFVNNKNRNNKSANFQDDADNSKNCIKHRILYKQINFQQQSKRRNKKQQPKEELHKVNSVGRQLIAKIKNASNKNA